MSCDNRLFLNKQLKIFRSNDRGLWLYWIDEIPNDDDAADSSIVSVSSLAEFYGKDSLSDSYTVEKLEKGTDTLFFTKSTNETFNLPVDIKGTLNPNVFWAGYMEGSTYSPIKEVKYYDMFYDEHTDSIDLVFWTNIDVNELPTNVKSVKTVDQFGTLIGDDSTSSSSTDSSDVLDDLYPDSVKVAMDDENKLDTNAQRCVFYSRGHSRSVQLTLSNGNKLVTSMFIFSKPVFLFTPGKGKESTADPVINEFPGFRFLELQ